MKKRPKIKCGWCGTKFVPNPRGRTPRYCKPSCRQRAYEGRRLKLVQDRYRMTPLDRLRRDLAVVELKDIVHKILVDARLVRPKPPPPRRRKPWLKVVQDEPGDDNP